jgi:membrane peptidoglycan carboxypeptidase
MSDSTASLGLEDVDGIERLTFGGQLAIHPVRPYAEGEVHSRTIGGANYRVALPAGWWVQSVTAALVFDSANQVPGFQRAPRGTALLNLVPEARDVHPEAIEAGRLGRYPHRSYASVMSDTARVVDTPRTPYLQGAGIVMDVRSGDVIALVGGRDFEDSKFNRAIQARRQPGSAFKPFVYAAALQAGHPPTTILEDTPYRLVRNGQVWEPRNYDGSYAGQITMRDALVRSQNIATIRLADMVGLDRVINAAYALGITNDIPRYPAVAIGAADVTVLEMVTAYATLAALGERPEPRFVTHVTDRHGRIVWQAEPRSRPAISPEVAFLTVDLMRDVVNRGTGATVRGAGFRLPAAGKTGTTNESSDVWFVGATPRLAAAVWLGFDERRRIMANATGGRLAAPIWGRAMRSIATDGADWSVPPGIERHQVDAYGNVVASNCPTYGELRQEYFLRGTAYALGCPDPLLGDTLDPALYDESWWERLRDRVIGRDGADTLLPRGTPPDTIILRPTPADTARTGPTRRDTVRPGPPPRDTVRRDGPIGVPVRPDTLGRRPPGDGVGI